MALTYIDTWEERSDRAKNEWFIPCGWTGLFCYT